MRGRTHRPKTPQYCPEVIADLISKVCPVAGTEALICQLQQQCCYGCTAVPWFYSRCLLWRAGLSSLEFKCSQ